MMTTTPDNLDDLMNDEQRAYYVDGYGPTLLAPEHWTPVTSAEDGSIWIGLWRGRNGGWVVSGFDEDDDRRSGYMVEAGTEERGRLMGQIRRVGASLSSGHMAEWIIDNLPPVTLEN